MKFVCLITDGIQMCFRKETPNRLLHVVQVVPLGPCRHLTEHTPVNFSENHSGGSTYKILDAPAPQSHFFFIFMQLINRLASPFGIGVPWGILDPPLSLVQF